MLDRVPDPSYHVIFHRPDEETIVGYSVLNLLASQGAMQGQKKADVPHILGKLGQQSVLRPCDP